MEDYVKKNYPNFPYPQPVECLNLLLRKEYGKQIVSGKKKVEWRDCTKHYFDRLIDKKTSDFLYNHREDKELRNIYKTAIRPVKKIHFHNYNETWWIDIKVEDCNVVKLTENGMKYLHERGIHDVDNEYERVKDADKDTYIPVYFYFKLGEIIDKHNI